MFGDIAEGPWNRLHQLIQKCLHFVAPQRPAAFDPIVLPVKLGFTVSFGQHLQEFAEHKEAADAHAAQQ
ncbi:hypothetical protein D3C74_480620 [compost metagenome]